MATSPGGKAMNCPKCGRKMEAEYDGCPSDVSSDGESEHLEVGCEVDFFCNYCLIGVWGWASEGELDLMGTLTFSYQKPT